MITNRVRRQGDCDTTFIAYLLFVAFIIAFLTLAGTTDTKTKTVVGQVVNVDNGKLTVKTAEGFDTSFKLGDTAAPMKKGAWVELQIRYKKHSSSGDEYDHTVIASKEVPPPEAAK